MYEEDIQNLKRIINELNLKININNSRDKEISSLKLYLIDMKKEYLKLSNIYESLLADFKININANERLRLLVSDLENKIETHNKSINGIDLNIKQQIENLTRQSLAKKHIEYTSSRDVVSKIKSDHEFIISKIENYTKQNLSYSEILPKYSFDITSSQNSVDYLKNGSFNITNLNKSSLNSNKNDENLVEITGYSTTEVKTDFVKNKENLNEKFDNDLREIKNNKNIDI